MKGYVESNFAKHLLSWPGMAVLASLNGAIRELTYADRLGQEQAHRLATVPLMVMLAQYFAFLAWKWPLRSMAEAWRLGAAWLGLTLAFEFGLGRLEGKPWSELFGEYNVVAGRIWIVVVLFILAGPALTWRLSHRRAQGDRPPAGGEVEPTGA